MAGHYETTVNKGDINVRALEREMNDRHEKGWKLAHMVEQGGKRYRVQELADAAHLSQSALSRLIARLERGGLVSRAMCDDDRRGVFVCITDEGRAKHADAQPTHRAVLADVLGEADAS